MIRIRKNIVAPQALNKSYNSDTVCEQLLGDQHGKCYLCERRRSTDYQVEHLKSQNHYPGDIYSWDNLFVACSYCNNRKSSKFDDILDPTLYDIETIIHHANDYINQKVIFSSRDTSSKVLSTMRLLSLLFNGKLAFRNLREQQFYDEFIRKLNVFSYAVDEYMSGKKVEYHSIIEEQLNINSEYLGFKYAIIHSNSLLEKDFGQMTVWNKKGD